ncbi:MAG: tetratricopeptide repeat protein [Gammaproteobacteria bacterium]|nr:tetratricopeptide repeat protein [Gammaproteobacteria bacterium]
MSELLDYAIEMHTHGRLDEAEAVYQQLLSITPDEHTALHFLGILLHQRDRSDAALAMIIRSIELSPPQPAWYNDLGNVLMERGEFAAAAGIFSQSLTLEPSDANVWNNLGAALQRCERLDEACAAFETSIALNPEVSHALNNLAALLSAQGKDNEAAEYYCRAFVLEPHDGKAKNMLGIAYYKLGRIADAAEIYRQWLFEAPGNATALHLYAACSGVNVPARASDDYIEETFDDYAKNFDDKLVGDLSYKGPDIITQALARFRVPEQRLDILDGGCGTGLCGPRIAPYARQLVGVDLSSKMLEIARQCGVYNALHKAELTRFLLDHPAAFDVIVIADTLIYFGSLDEVFTVSANALRPGGLLIFTHEQASDITAHGNYQINPNGRHSHDTDYVRASLKSAGFDVQTMDAVEIRKEFTVPVAGWVTTAVK